MLVVYDPGLTGYHEIRFESYQTEEWYNGIGTFTLIVSPTAHNIANLIKGAILYRSETRQTMLVTRVNPDTSQGRITVNGYTANRLLNKRSISVARSITTVETGIYDAISDNLRSLPNIQTASVKSLSETYDALLYGGQLLDEIIPVLDAVELGQKAFYDKTSGKITFEIYKGEDLAAGSHAVVFSDEQGTARDLKIEDDESTFANVCYVLGTLTDGTSEVRTVGAASAGDRYEYWHDSRLKQSSGEALADFQARLDSAGLAELAKRVRKTGFSVRIDPTDFGVAYALGSVVKCVSKRFNFSFTARIKGVKRTAKAQSETVSLTLGEPTLTVLGEMKLYG